MDLVDQEANRPTDLNPPEESETIRMKSRMNPTSAVAWLFSTAGQSPVQSEPVFNTFCSSVWTECETVELTASGKHFTRNTRK